MNNTNFSSDNEKAYFRIKLLLWQIMRRWFINISSWIAPISSSKIMNNGEHGLS
jgi:hypothetical protein